MAVDEESEPEVPTGPFKGPGSTGRVHPPVAAGKACPNCQSFETRGDGELATRPGVVRTMFFGLYYLLVRGAFARKAIHCSACGETSYYKTTGSVIAMVLLITIVILFFASYLAS